jgi:hypothetical protein
MRRSGFVLLVTLLAIAPVLSACENFDLDKFDIFGLSEKKKLPGDRRPVFPEGVPGVSQGVPPELVKGYQPPPEAEAPPEQEAAAAEKPKPKRKPKPRVATPASQPTQVTVQPTTPQQQAAPPWPAPASSGTFQR